jgi:hypothetical protein
MLSWFRCGIAILFSIFTLSGCASGYYVDDLGYSLTTIQTAVNREIPNGVESVSPNRREFFSKLFDPSSLSTKYRDGVYRARAHVLVLGDRRPYNLEVRSVVEKRVSGGKPKEKISSPKDLSDGDWESYGSDYDLAQSIGESIADYLLKASRGRNLIDDFQAF